MELLSEVSKIETVRQAKRFKWWWLLSVAPVIAVMFIAPQQGGVLLFKVAQLSIGVLLVYAADRALFKHAPRISIDMPRDNLSAALVISRAIVALAVLIALTLGI